MRLSLRSKVLAITGVVALTIGLPATTFAQSGVTPAEFRIACETSPQTVFLPTGAKIARAVATEESVITGCTVILGADVYFNFV